MWHSDGDWWVCITVVWVWVEPGASKENSEPPVLSTEWFILIKHGF